MYEFLEYIKQYLKDTFENDSDISASKKPEVYTSDKVSHEPSQTKPEIQVKVMDFSERTSYTTFCGVVANSIPLQISTYCGQMSIARKTYNAQDASMILAEKAVKALYKLIYSNKYPKLSTGRHITTSAGLPMNEGGTIYVTNVRFEFTVEV